MAKKYQAIPSVTPTTIDSASRCDTYSRGEDARLQSSVEAPALRTNSESLGVFVRDGIIGIATKLVELKPYVEELWRRLDNGEVILGCSTKKEFCQQVLQRTPRAVRYMLEGGNHTRGETVSPAAARQVLPEVTDAEFAVYEGSCGNGIRKSAANLLHQKGMTRVDVVGALVGMSYPKSMAEAAVRIVIGPQPVEQQLVPDKLVVMPKSLQDIRFERCPRTDPRYEDIREDHYIPNHGCIGEQIHFLVHYKSKLTGIISGASPVYSTAPRDEFFGLDKRNRGEFLQGIVNNVVFRLENHEPNLASRVLCLWRKVIPHLWYEEYGRVVYGFETFVIEKDDRKGSLYKADNWTLAGTTAGATKVRNGIKNPANNWTDVTPKLVYCKWRDGFSHPCSARTPEWVRTITMCEESAGSSEVLPATIQTPSFDEEVAA